MATDYLPSLPKGEINETVEKLKKATAKLGNLYGEYGRSRKKYG